MHPLPADGSGGQPSPQQIGPGFDPLDPSTYGAALQQLGQDAADVAGQLFDLAKKEGQLLPGTLAELPNALLDSLQSGASIDSAQGLAKNSKLMGLISPGVTSLLPDAPIFGNQGTFDQGANTVAPLADDAALQATVGRVIGGLGCLAKLGGRAGRALGLGLQAGRLGMGAKTPMTRFKV